VIPNHPILIWFDPATTSCPKSTSPCSLVKFHNCGMLVVSITLKCLESSHQCGLELHQCTLKGLPHTGFSQSNDACALLVEMSFVLCFMTALLVISTSPLFVSCFTFVRVGLLMNTESPLMSPRGGRGGEFNKTYSGIRTAKTG
jgi:hypothetical protein